MDLSVDFIIILLSVVIGIFLLAILFLLVKLRLHSANERLLSRLLQQKKYDECIRIARENVEQNEPGFFTLYTLATALEATEKLSEALIEYEKAAARVKDIHMKQNILLKQGRLLNRLGKKDKAFSYFLMISIADENFFEAQHEIAKHYFEKKQYGKAHDTLKSLLSVKPGLIESRFLYGLTLHYMGQYKFAVNQFKLLEKHDPEHADVFYYKGLSLENGKNLTLAVKAFSRYLEFDNIPGKQKKDALIRLIGLYIKLKDYKGAKEMLANAKTIINNGPLLPELYYLQGFILWNTGAEYDAFKAYEQVYKIDPTYKDIIVIFDKYKKYLPHHKLSVYFTDNEIDFEHACRNILGPIQLDLLYRSLNFYLFGHGKLYVIFYRHIEPLSFALLTDMEVLAATFDADLQNFEIYALGGAANDAITHAFLKRAVLISENEFLQAVKRIKEGNII